MKTSERIILTLLIATMTLGGMSFIKACGGQSRAMAEGLHEIGGGVSDHGQLVGLTDDDHTAYYKRNEQATFSNVTTGKAVLSGMLRVASAGSFSAALFKSTDNTVFFDVDAFTNRLAYIRWLENGTENWSMYSRGNDDTLRISPRFHGAARHPSWIYYPHNNTVLKLVTATGVNTAEIPKFEIYSTGGLKTYQNAQVVGTLTVTGDSYFSNTSSTGNADVAGNVTVWGSSDTYGVVTAHGGITGLVSAAKRTIYVDFDAGSDSNGGTSFVDAYATTAKVATEIPAIIKPFHNYSVYFRGTNTSSYALSDIVTPSSCVYSIGQVTAVDTGTVTSYYNNATYPDGLSRVSDGAASFGNYSGYMLTVNGVNYTVSYTNTTSVHIYGKFEANPSGAFTVSSYDWRQNGGISFANLGSFHLTQCRISGAPGNAITLDSASGMMSAIYIHDCTTGQGRAVSMTACPSVTADEVVSRANKNGFIVFGSSVTPTYCSAIDGTTFGYNFSGGSSGLVSYCESDNNATGYQYTNTATTSGLFTNNRAQNCTTGIQVDGNSYCKSITGALIDTCTTGINVADGGQARVSGASTISNNTTGVAAANHGGVYGTASVTYSGNSADETADATSYGFID